MKKFCILGMLLLSFASFYGCNSLKNPTNNGASKDSAAFRISYELNGGTNDTGNPNSYSSAAAIVLKEPLKDGYTFLGWTPDDSIPIGSSGDKVFTANWTVNAYNIILDYNGATDSITISMVSVNYGDNYSLPIPGKRVLGNKTYGGSRGPILTVLGYYIYEFYGWYSSDQTFTSKFGVSLSPFNLTSDIVLVAKWSAFAIDFRALS
ncbi:MAG: InlB B-repeat-containing protein [Clostridiales bacterium]|jgi:uncharacterized repeat protein (TIGR02543 family)|nr:InlB B-repeat-containing protein [Clostridiales bacterium]